jgi:hypothetical protein
MLDCADGIAQSGAVGPGGWRFSVPLIAALGFVVAYPRRRPRYAAKPSAATWIVRIGVVVLVSYGILVTLTWALVLLRGFLITSPT